MKTNQNIILTCLDHTVSKEEFDLILDKDLEMLCTSPRPKNNELGNYYESDDYISHTDSKSSLFDKVYQIVKNHTIKQKVKLINNHNSNKGKLLEIGCGTGDFLKACLNDGWSVCGIEPNKGARKLAKEKIGNKNTDSIKEDFQLLFDHQEVIAQYDVITMWHVLEHLPDLPETINNLKKLLKPNGTLIIAVPNYKSYDAIYYGKFWAAYDVPRHLWHFSQRSIQLLFSKVNLTVSKTLPMKFDAYYVSLLSEKYKSKFSNPVKALYRGFLSNRKARKSNEYSSLIYIIKNSK